MHELDSKTSLIKDLSLNYDKLKLIQSGLETRLQDSERVNDQIKDEYKALSLQVCDILCVHVHVCVYTWMHVYDVFFGFKFLLFCCLNC